VSADTEPVDSDTAWEQAWSAQHGLCREIDDRIRTLTEGRSDAFGAALTAYLIEHLRERMRVFLRLPGSDERAEDADA